MSTPRVTEKVSIKFHVVLHFCVALYLKQVTTRNDIILKVEEQSRLEKEINYEDRWPILNFRKSVTKFRIYINMAA